MLHELSQAEPDVVHVAPGITATRTADAEPPEFAAGAADLRRCEPVELPEGYLAAWRLTAPLVSMPAYLGYLHERYLKAGGRPVQQQAFGTLADSVTGTGGRVIVNCTGCGARTLVPDPAVAPVRGQVVVTSNPGVSQFFVGVGAEPGDLTYFFPHGESVVLGGTEQLGNWSREPDPGTATRIVAACAAVEPKLADAAVLEHRVGLRPGRPQVRLETALADDGTTVVHNYGHGGSGVTLSWGCAEEAAGLALAALG
jgi:D-amino-acid oxidase